MRDLQTRLRKLSAAVAAALIASTFIAVLPASAATITAVGSLVQSSGSGKSTLSVNPQHVGDAFVLSIGVFPSSPTVSSVSGGGSTWSRVSYTTVSGDIEEWLGAITTTGSSTITVTFSGSISGVQDELLAQEFSSSTGSSTTWALDVAGNATTSSNSTTVTMPTLSPAGSGELYVDYSAVDNSGSAGSTTGFTYDVTSEGSIFAYDPSVSSSVTPIASQSPTGTYTETAALLTASSSGGGTSSTTTLTASPSSPQNPATSITLTATVTTGATGTVNFELGGTSLSGCSAKTLSSSVATCTTTALVAGTNSFVAIYSGDSTYAGSTSSTLNYVGLTPQATLTVTSTSGAYGTPLTLTTSGGSGTGAVTYTTTNGTASGCAVSSGALSSTSAGTCMVTATKASDGTYQSISSSATTVTLSTLTSSTTTLTASPSSPQNPATSITLTATVTTGATGTVNFELGGTSLSGCSAKTLSSSVATCTTTALAAGTNSFVAIYSGNSSYAGSTSSTLTYTGLVPSAPGSVSVTASNGNVKVSWTAGGTVTGVTVVGYTATAFSGATAVGTCVTLVSGPTPLNCTIPSLPLSTSLTFSVTASSATATGPSTSATSPSSLTLSLLASSISVSAIQLSPQNLNTPITFAATVTTGATGTVEFENGGALITGCQYRIVNSGYATCTTSSLTAATHSITAIYSGDANYATSTSSTLSFTISSTTLTAATAPLLITSTGAAINTTISLVVSGGNGAGAVTFGVVNGSATGCSVSGTTLSVPSNVSGTCLVSATQASSGTYLGDVSNVSIENFFWNYATYPNYFYVCNSGDTLSGSTCTHETLVGGASEYSGYYCSSGWSGPISGNVCWRDAYISQASCTNNGGVWEGSYCYLTVFANYGTDGGAFGYYCTGGELLVGTSCYSTSTYGATLDESFSCPYGGTLSGMICSISGGSGPNLRLPRRSSIAGSPSPPNDLNARSLRISFIASRSSLEAP